MKHAVEFGAPLRQPDREGFHHIGHSTHWIVFKGVRLLTDPWISEPAHRSLSHRVRPCQFPTDPDLVLISHGHEDHFDPVALDQVDRSARVIVPSEKVEQATQKLGFQTFLARPGERFEFLGLTFLAVLGKHDVFELCFQVTQGEHGFFFGGDTMLCPSLEAYARENQVAFAVLPGERSSLLGKRFVMNPEEACSFAKSLGVSRAVLTHHESYVSHRFPLGWLISVPEAKPEEFPEWFLIPKPGDHVDFPWQGAAQ